MAEALSEPGTSSNRSLALVGAAVHRNSPISRKGLSERTFTLAFSNLVYAQIWEDPRVDLVALAVEPGQRMVTIASGGCNLISYLAEAPLDLVAVDLNAAHVAFNRLKLAALRHVETYEQFFSLYGHAASDDNIAIYDRLIAQYLDASTLAYWEVRDWRGRRRIEWFTNGLYKHGLLGTFIGTGHRLAKLLGGNPRALMAASSIEDQRRIFEREIRPLLSKLLVRKLLARKSSLFGLGIPPAQYEALSGGRPMHKVIEERFERLACGFDIKDNYFAWQAFNRGYDRDGMGPLPPYLERANFERLRANTRDVVIENINFTEFLARQPVSSIDRYSLLDAQDWMSDETLNDLWRQIDRTAKPGARVIFRTAGEETILPGRVDDAILRRWHYAAEHSLELTGQDRSAIYGGFHYYIKTK